MYVLQALTKTVNAYGKCNFLLEKSLFFTIFFSLYYGLIGSLFVRGPYILTFDTIYSATINHFVKVMHNEFMSPYIIRPMYSMPNRTLTARPSTITLY